MHSRETPIEEIKRQARQRRRAMCFEAFCDKYGIGRTKAYEEINAGRLKARKCGRRTIILEDDAENWLDSLPAFVPADATV